ncbi:MAG: N-6 DNA methylase [Myxococcota bacterium]
MSTALIAAGFAAIEASGRKDVPWPEPQPGEPAPIVDGDPAAWLGQVHQQVTAPEHQRRRSAHYTPAPLASQVAEHTLAPLLAQTSDEAVHKLRIVDPACGAGAFLLAAHRVIRQDLARRGVPDPERCAGRVLVGVDRDPWACRLARLALCLRSGLPLDQVYIHEGDALLGASDDPRQPTPDGSVHWPDLLPHGADAIVANPPFLGGKRIRTVLGAPVRTALLRRRALGGNTDLAAHFLHLSAEILRPGGRAGWVLTDTIAQGDTHRAGLGALVPTPFTLVRAQRSTEWPGAASVRIAVVHAVHGPSDEQKTLNKRPVPHIGSHLRSDPLDHVPPPRPGPRPGVFIGCDLKGPGFLFGDGAQHDRTVLEHLRRQDPRLDEIVRPYVCGATLTRRPDNEPTRWVADLSDLDLETARERHPQLMARLQDCLPADRATRSAAVQKTPWFRFWRTRQNMRRALLPLQRCLVAPVVSSHVQWSWQPTDRVFNHKVVVVATDDDFIYGALQCALHAHWARALSSTLGEGINYSPSRCFASYPLPPRTDAIAEAARRVEAARAMGTAALGVGRSALQRQSEHASPPNAYAHELRRSLAHLDDAVLTAWGWTDLDLGDVDACLTRLLSA